MFWLFTHYAYTIYTNCAQNATIAIFDVFLCTFLRFLMKRETIYIETENRE